MSEHEETSLSLLDAIRHSTGAAQDQAAWQRMFQIYQPLIEKWLRRFSAPQQDIDDLVQEVLTIVVKKIDEFERVPRTGAFRAWLRNTTQNILFQLWRQKKYEPLAMGDSDFQEVLNQLKQESSELSQQWNREYDQHILRAVLGQVEQEFSEQTWQAFYQIAVEGQSARSVAEGLGISVNAAFIAKSRVLARIRSFGRYLVDLDARPMGQRPLGGLVPGGERGAVTDLRKDGN